MLCISRKCVCFLCQLIPTCLWLLLVNNYSSFFLYCSRWGTLAPHTSAEPGRTSMWIWTCHDRLISQSKGRLRSVGTPTTTSNNQLPTSWGTVIILLCFKLWKHINVMHNYGQFSTSMHTVQFTTMKRIFSCYFSSSELSQAVWWRMVWTDRL